MVNISEDGQYYSAFDHQVHQDKRPFYVDNWLWDTYRALEPLHMLLNPDVTVREKGVMEKCTFCVQRIRGAQNRARLEDRSVKDGDIVTACQQTCPSDAIVFGDLNDHHSRVFELAGNPRGYHVLAGLNTKPAITYLARVVAQDAPSHG